MRLLRVHSVMLAALIASGALAQQTQSATAVPRLVRFSGSFRPANGGAAPSIESVTLAVYRDQTGGTPLWQEVQNVSVDADGRYSLLMGSTLNDGMPVDLFNSGESRWLGVQVNKAGEIEQPRVMMVSVPYALKASDAETLGGKPASAYLLAARPTTATTTASGSTAAATTSTPTANVTSQVKPRVNSGSANAIGKFVNTTDLTSSSMTEIGGNVGIFAPNPLISLDVRTGALPQMGIAGTTDYLTFFASDVFGPAIYWDPAKDMRFGKGGASLYNPFGFVEQMRIQSSTGNVGIGTQSPASKLDVNGSISFSGSLINGGNPVLQFPGGVVGQNVSLGVGALPNSTTGVSNVASGFGALHTNSTGVGNTASGVNALQNNTTGSANTASGLVSLQENTTGGANTADGFAALLVNTTGGNNTAIGDQAMLNNTTGSFNTAVGFSSLVSVTGGYNIALGTGAGGNLGPNSSNNIDIGNSGLSGDVGTIRIGRSGAPVCFGCGPQTSFFAAGIRGVTTANNDAIPVMIDSAGQLGTISSSRRFKEDITDMGDASEDLMRLRPVTYRYKQPFADGSKPIQYGLIAEEVAEVYPDLVAHSSDGQIETVKYQVLDSMLLNEIQRQQAQIRKLEERLAKLEAKP